LGKLLNFLGSLGLEQRSTLAAPDQWFLDALGAAPTKSGASVNERTALNVSGVLACVKVLAESVASLPLHVYQRTGSGKERASDHALYTLLHTQPNPEMTSFIFRETLMSHLLLWGNAFAAIEYDKGGRVKGLWPMLPDRTKVERRAGLLRYITQDGNGAEVEFSADEVLHIPGLGFNGLTGYSPVHMAREAIGFALSAEEYGARLFSNGARPGGFISSPLEMSDEARKRFLRSWQQGYQGGSNAHKIALLEGGMKFEAVGLPPEDAQFLQLRKFQLNEIARIYRVPPHMVGDLEKSSFSNIEQQSLDYLTHTLRPWLVRWEQAILTQLFMKHEQERYFAEFAVDGLLRGDVKSRYEAYSIGRQNGWLSANDIRALENMNPIEGGEIYLTPLNMTAVGQEAPAPETKSREMRSRNDGQARRQIMAAQAGIFTDAAARVIAREKADIMRQAEKMLRTRGVFDFNAWLSEFYYRHEEYVSKQFAPLVEANARAIFAAAADEIGLKADAPVDFAKRVKELEADLVHRVVSKSQKDIRERLAKAVDGEEDPVEALRETFEEWQETRPNLIGVNEATRVGNAIAVLAFIVGGVQYMRTVAENGACAYCRGQEGRRIDISQGFDIYQVKNHHACRCTAVAE